MANSEFVLTQEQERKLRQCYMDPEEELAASLGNGYLTEYLSTGMVRKAFALVTDCRVYFKGKSYSGRGSALNRYSEECVVDLQDVTGTSYLHASRIGCLIRAILSFAAILFTLAVYNENEDAIVPLGLIGIILCVLFLKNLYQFIMRSGTWFVISYAGGSIKFDVSKCSKREANDFQKVLRQAKDRLQGNKRMD